MAKQPVNIVERHLEKGVLGICALVLLAAVALFLVSSPNKIELGGESVGPGTIDEHVRDAGNRLRDRLRSAERTDVAVEDFVPELAAATSPLAYASIPSRLPASAPMLPRVPEIGDAVPKAGEIKLAPVIAPDAPVVTKGRSQLFMVPPQLFGSTKPGTELPEREVFKTDVNWVSVGALFNQQRQIAVCNKAGYKAGRRNPYIIGVDLQRRLKQSDGTYGEWIDVKAYAPLLLPPLPSVEITPGRKGSFVATEATRGRVSAFFGVLRTIQTDLLRPLFPEKRYGDDWLYPKFPGIDVAALDNELCVSADGACPPRPYPPQSDLVSAAPTVQKTDKERLEESRGQMEQFRRDRSCDDAIAKALEMLANPAATAKDKSDAEGVKSQMERDKAQGRCKEKAEEVHEEEGAKVRAAPNQLIWAHDAATAAEGGAASGRTYQYRMRVRLYNRFCAVPSDVADPKDAESVFVVGDWSEPSPEVYILPDTQFFLAGGNPSTQSGAKVTIFKWYEGVWVDATFAAETGKEIRGSSPQPVHELPDGTTDKPMIDFETGARVVDIDYDYAFRAKRSRGKGGFGIEEVAPTVALVFKDVSGELRERILSADRMSDEFKLFKDRPRKPGDAK